MKLLCVGGGSGGHITPIVAIVDKLRSSNGLSSTEIRVWCDRKFIAQAKGLFAGKARVDVIAAGKLRRYANLKWWYRWFSPYHIIHTHIPNLIDLFKIIAGFCQSLVKLLVWRPDVVFCKGCYVCLPVGVAAHLLHIPLVLHDSDTVPGLTNRVLSRFASAIGTGAPVKNYPGYPRRITKYVGIPVRKEIKPVNMAAQKQLKTALGFDATRPLVLAMGGGLGATDINRAIEVNAGAFTKNSISVYLLTGKGKDVSLSTESKQYIKAVEFSDDIVQLEQAADLVVTRAGATTMAELATMRLPTIIVPSPYLAGDHQTKNAKVYERAGAAVVINQFELEKQPSLLMDKIEQILHDARTRRQLSANLAKFARPHALDDMIDMIIEVSGHVSKA